MKKKLIITPIVDINDDHLDFLMEHTVKLGAEIKDAHKHKNHKLASSLELERLIIFTSWHLRCTMEYL